jgi:alkanesulfonate monooxygenase SsuD/methylene tetrahydromethanopterin reductase-like flavin-dependent oxidoreductase (luciferase family)
LVAGRSSGGRLVVGLGPGLFPAVAGLLAAEGEDAGYAEIFQRMPESLRRWPIT